MKANQLKPMFVAVAAAFALLAAPVAFDSLDGVAFAQTSSGKGQMGPTGDRGQGGAGQAGGRGGSVVPLAEDEPDEDKKGPKYGGGSASPEPGERGGRPAWAGGTVDDVELGRLNVARAPGHVLDRALAEALATMDPTLYWMPDLEAVVYAILNETALRVDSPLQNLALYKDMLVDGTIGDGTKVPVNEDNFLLLAAIFVGGAAEKTLPITVDTVEALNTIMGLTLPSYVTVEQVAQAADAVRAAILQAHEQ
jgi:hypothetical protein